MKNKYSIKGMTMVIN